MEIWKSIEGYENYEISNLGNVKSLYNNIIRKPRIGKNGYYYITLWKNGKCKSKKNHRLVAEAFIPNPDNLPQVNHKDGNKLNNCVDNLEWCTASYNVRHAIKNGLFNTNNLFKCGKENPMHNIKIEDNPHAKCVLQYDLRGNFIKKWNSVKMPATELKINHIDACCRGERKTAGGYIWKYN
ncbi:MAG: hypothetical protein E7161_04530 [Firmicutes bacterium]|nr:hypothetical protein [Bacillota bacterium]